MDFSWTPWWWTSLPKTKKWPWLLREPLRNLIRHFYDCRNYSFTEKYSHWTANADQFPSNPLLQFGLITPARFAVDAEKTSSSTVLFFSPTKCKLPSPEILRSGMLGWSQIRAPKDTIHSFAFPSATRYTPCLKNYALQTRIPNREKDLSLELEIALVISSVLKTCNKRKLTGVCWKHGKSENVLARPD